MQAAGIARSWRSNRAAAYQQYQDKSPRGQYDISQRTRWREWHIPTLREPCLQANVNVVKLEVSRNSTYDYWLSISTLEKGQLVPVKSAEYDKGTEGPKTGQIRKLTASYSSTSVTGCGGSPSPMMRR